MSMRKPTSRKGAKRQPNGGQSASNRAPTKPKKRTTRRSTVLDRTEERRQRVRELIGKADRRIAQVLIKEGFFDAGAAEDPSPAYAKFLEGCRRVVNLDRNAIRDAWKELTTKPRGDDPVQLEEFVARLDTRIDDLDAVLESGQAKPTAKVMAIAEIRQLETLKGKVRGLNVDGKGNDDGGDEPSSRVPFVGVVVDMAEISPEARVKIDAWRNGKR